MRNFEHIETDRLQAAADLGKRFIQRWDLYAKQLPDGSYVCVRKPLTAQALLSHLEGKITLGAYLMDVESKVRHVVLDTDEENGLDAILEFAQKLETEGVQTYPELSRRGAHLWLFFENPIPAELARKFTKGILSVHQLENVEVYPKQDKTADDGPGSLIKLPFGIHRKSGARYPFITSRGEPLAETVREQIRLLANAQAIPERMLEIYAEAISEKKEQKPHKWLDRAVEPSWERIKDGISVMDFIGQYIELRPTSRGAVGKCPFHEDDHASFGVNAKGNYWHCFAGCGGGDIISFWMKWKGIDFSQAVTELTGILGVEKP